VREPAQNGFGCGPRLPMVSALMVTGKSIGHERWARVALRCFLEQTWPAANRELVIVNDGAYRLLERPNQYQLPDGRQLVREVVVPQDRNALGVLRNIGLDAAKGEYAIQWDDDDWHGPSRIALQAAPIVGRRAVCTFLTRQVRYSIPFNSAKVFTAARIHGTIMHRVCDIRYPALRRCEDTEFMFRFLSQFGAERVADVAVAIESCDRVYIRLHHGRNTWNATHIMGLSVLQPGNWRLGQDACLRLQGVLLDYFGLSRAPKQANSPCHT
jgi:glycosyltransferase involved in cell wall biosynthesis